MAEWLSKTARGQANRFEVRVHTTTASRVAVNTRYSRCAKIEIGMLAVAEIARQWARAHGTVTPGTRVDVIDSRDGGVVVSMHYHGYERGTFDYALDVLRTNGFDKIEEVSPSSQGGNP